MIYVYSLFHPPSLFNLHECAQMNLIQRKCLWIRKLLVNTITDTVNGSSVPGSCLCLWFSIPFLPTVPLPVPLRHHHSCHHRDHHSHRDHKHGDCFCHAELAVNPPQRRSGQLGRVLAAHVAVVVDVEVANVEDLAEDAMEFTVTVPGVSWWSHRRGKDVNVYSL